MLDQESLWTTKTMVINTSLFVLSILISISILAQKSIEGLIIFLVCIFVIIIPFRWVVCRNCKYYGLICPSFGFSLIAKIFPPKKPEERVFQRTAVIVDFFLIGFTFLIPVIIWIASFLPINSVYYSQLDHVVMIGYIILALVMTFVHNRTACSKCDITDCWLCAGHK
ncbi:MAG: hypothetical protein JSU57_02820 [Candidatus Heimdallarchaeota archaeon]|nr:MAG: hypothetical protein JSU57_02820 [Candidatus Heimdallarchaeota archaeon]